MLLGIGFKVILISTVLLGVLVPARARILAGRGGGLGSVDGPFSVHPVVGLIPPLAQTLDFVTTDANTGAGSDKRLSKLAVALVFAAPLSAFAVIPFGLGYRLGESEVNLVIANLEWGILWLQGSAILGVCSLIGLVRGTQQRVRYGTVAISHVVGAGLALVAVAMVFGTLEPLSIAVAQDRDLALGGFFGPALPMVQRLRVPGWGMFFQPLSLLLFLVSALAIPRAPESLRTGAELFLVRASEHLGSLLVSSVIVTLFAGGGALPYLRGDEIIDAIGVYYGTGLATLLCMVIHMSVFLAKVIVVALAIEPLRDRLARLSLDRSLNLCWKVIIPFSLLNLFVTAHVLVASGTP